MSQLKDMYRTVEQDAVPETVGLDFGDTRLVYRRRRSSPTWILNTLWASPTLTSVS